MCETNLESLEVIFDNSLALLEMIHAMYAVTLLHLLPQILHTHIYIYIYTYTYVHRSVT